MEDTDGSDRETVAEKPVLLIAEDKGKKYRSFRTRTISTVVLVALFLLIIYMGHVFLVGLVFTLQWMMVKELFALARSTQKDDKLPGFRAQQWYFFFVAAFYMYLRFIKTNLLVELTSQRTLTLLFSWILTRHTIISYSLYIIGFVAFVLSLKKRMYLYQFGQYAWTHMILMVVFIPSSFFVSNIFEGLIWLLLPCSLIITNDIMAYLAGFFFGRTPLIKLSPKKTWEGFVGGFIGTVVAAFYIAKFCSRFKWMTCPRRDLSIGWLDCVQDELYIPVAFTIRDTAACLPSSVVDVVQLLSSYLPPQLVSWLMQQQLMAEPMQVHAVVLAVFASFIAPFGGFFASGFKRAFKMKDFGDTIPGHGGVTDRFDCQILMAMFSYLYYWNFVSKPELTVGSVLALAVKLDPLQQSQLLGKLANLLSAQDLIPARLADEINNFLALGHAR